MQDFRDPLKFVVSVDDLDNYTALPECGLSNSRVDGDDRITTLATAGRDWRPLD